MPLANDARPTSFKDMVGNPHLVGENGVLTTMLDKKKLRSCIFFGSPGCGKTTAARILAEQSGLDFVYMNATTDTVKDLRSAIDEHDDPSPLLIYLDEIQYFNKKQQQTLLSLVEDGTIILIAATTENPYHDVYKALLSRCLVLEFKPVPTEAIRARLSTVLDKYGITDHFTNEVVDSVAHMAAGDLRRALNIIETLDDSYNGTPIDRQYASSVLPTTNMGSFDTDSDQHYRYKAALQKSIRGSDPNAAVFWLNQLLEGGDMVSPSRRMMVMASEDVGLADPMAVPIVLACLQAAERVGLPEARYPLTQAAIYLATAPKSNSIGQAFSKAIDDIHNGYGTVVPTHIASECPKDYIYPHPFPYHWTPQQYMPDDRLDTVYYEPGDNSFEQQRKAYWDAVKSSRTAHN